MKSLHLLLVILTCSVRCIESRKQASLLPHACSSLSPHIEFRDPSNYNPNNPPSLVTTPGGNSSSSPVILVESQHRVMDVTEVSDVKRTVSLQLVSYKMWTDHRVKASDKPSFIREELFRKCLWSPHFLFVNLHSSEDLHLSKTPNVFMVDGDSTVMSVTYAVVTVGCNMRFNMYPFDYQECDVLEVPMELDLTRLASVGTTDHESAQQRELQYLVAVGDSPVTTHRVGNFNYTASGSRIYLKRRLNIHVLETYLPTSLFVVASWISFLVPPEVIPGRMGMLVTLLLVQVNIALGVSARAPITSKITALSFWCLLCIIHVMAAIVQYGYLLHMSRLGQYRAIRDKIIGKKTNIRRSVDKTSANSVPGGGDKEEAEPIAGSPPTIVNVPEQGVQMIDLKRRQQRLDRISFVVFPATSLCVGLAYWAICMGLSTELREEYYYV